MNSLEHLSAAPFEQITRLHALLEADMLARSDVDLAASLDRIAAAVAETLGLRVVIVNLYRREWDDYIAATICAPPEVRDELLGSTYGHDFWPPLLQERFARRGAYVIPHGSFDWSDVAGKRIPLPRRADADPDAWHPEDEIFVPFYGLDEELLGVFCVGDPVSGRRPSDAALDALVAVARHAASAVAAAQQSAAAISHRRALEELLRVSAQLTENLDIERILGTVCAGISDALAFERVTVQLVDPGTHKLRAHAAVQVEGEPAVHLGLTLEQARPLFVPRFEIERCYLLSQADACALAPVPPLAHRSTRNGVGPHAWNDHWLLVPLVHRSGELIGLIWVDAPRDRLLPDRDRLQALRLFANQTSTALDSARQFEEMRTLARRDPLTQLLNRRSFVERLEAELELCRLGDEALTLVFCDLDGFKRLNDSLGHHAGDAALQVFANALARCVVDGESFRVGGDEFALVLPRAGADDALQVIERIGIELGNRRRGDILSASFGIAVVSDDVEDASGLLRAADSAMYEAKRAGDVFRIAA